MIFERKRVLSAADRFIKDIHNLPKDVKDNTIILIGPMGTGKSTIGKILAEKENRQQISFDKRRQFQELYKREKRFNNFKNFEFALTGTILSSLKNPSIIDFGAGHSIYEEPELKEKMKEMCSEFKNIVLLMPTEDKEESREILLKRRRFEIGSKKDRDNWHFITAPDNYELATDIIYENERTPEEISEEILDRINKKNKEIDINREEI